MENKVRASSIINEKNINQVNQKVSSIETQMK